MRYLGGKAKHGEEIARIIRSKRRPGQTIREPFVGAAWVTQYLYSESVICSDNHKPLIQLHQAIQCGTWKPPDFISEEEYDELHQLWEDGECSPLIGFVGFACSWGAKWFGGYARGDNRNFCLEAKESLLKKHRRLKHVIFEHKNYKNIDPGGIVIYCDPPYHRTTGYRGEIFDAVVFWEIVRHWSKNNIVLVSEYQAPSDFAIIWQSDRYAMKSTDAKLVTEKLFQLEK